jgi:hypothetical protein
VDRDKIFPRKIMFSHEATFDISGKVNTQNICSGDQNTLTLHCSILLTAPKLTCGVACSTIIWPNPLSLPKELWHPAITWICCKTSSIHSYRNLNVSCSSSKMVHHHNTAWICMHLLISIFQTNQLAILVPSLGQHGHGIPHRDFFHRRIHKRLSLRNSSG